MDKRGKALLPLPLQGLGWDVEKVGTCAIEVKMVPGEVMYQFSLGKERIGWEVDPFNVHESLGSQMVILRKYLVCPIPETKINPG